MAAGGPGGLTGAACRRSPPPSPAPGLPPARRAAGGDNLARQSAQFGVNLVPVPKQAWSGDWQCSALAAGYEHGCCLQYSRDFPAEVGLVRCWGSNEYGALGLGTTSTTPVHFPEDPVAGGRTYSAISATNYAGHTCALEAGTGLAYCWGISFSRQVGGGLADSVYSVPTPADPQNRTFAAVVAGGEQTVSLVA